MMPQVPPAIPARTKPQDYHFHTYDFTGSKAFTLSSHQPNRGQFYSLVEDLKALQQNGRMLKVPNITIKPVGGSTEYKKRTWMLSFGNLNNAQNCPTVVITGGIHAREWIAAEIAYLIAEYLIVNYPDANSNQPLTQNQQLLKTLVDTRNIHIIPMINPDGNLQTVFGLGSNDRDWRKNCRELPEWGGEWVTALAPGATPPFKNVQVSLIWPRWAYYDVPEYVPPYVPPRTPKTYRTHKLDGGIIAIGVDLNRNMDTQAWGYDCKLTYANGDPTSDDFFGTGPGSEPETKSVQKAMALGGGIIDVAIDYHSYSRLILYPGETPPYTASQLHRHIGELLEALIEDSKGNNYELGYSFPLLRYDGTGTVADYATQRHAAKAAFTIELDPSDQGQGLTGFTLPENQIQAVFETNIRGALAAIAAPQNYQDAVQVMSTYGLWDVYDKGNRLP
jgi:hypothetical protein